MYPIYAANLYDYPKMYIKYMTLEVEQPTTNQPNKYDNVDQY